MHIKVLPSQIPQVWEAVKYAIVQLNEVPQEHMKAYLLWMLHQLLSEKAQCWVTLNEQRILLNVSITRIATNPFTKEPELHLQCLYAFQGLTDHIVTEALALYRQFAKSVGCARITGASRHPRACAIMEQYGFQPNYRTYTFSVEN